MRAARERRDHGLLRLNRDGVARAIEFAGHGVLRCLPPGGPAAPRFGEAAPSYANTDGFGSRPWCAPPSGPTCGIHEYENESWRLMAPANQIVIATMQITEQSKDGPKSGYDGESLNDRRAARRRCKLEGHCQIPRSASATAFRRPARMMIFAAHMLPRASATPQTPPSTPPDRRRQPS